MELEKVVLEIHDSKKRSRRWLRRFATTEDTARAYDHVAIILKMWWCAYDNMCGSMWCIVVVCVVKVLVRLILEGVQSMVLMVGAICGGGGQCYRCGGFGMGYRRRRRW